ncbi:MAG TPA: hypothetical protein VME45_04130 [Stellaceae bacterium]|nr:hypothetical protein [Stellaceae bacterium]
MLGLLIFATIGDLLLAVLLIAVSGFILGSQEGMSGDPSAVALWVAGVAACLAMPIIGFVLRAKSRPGIGALVAATPVLGGLLVTFWPFHPY